MTLQKAKPKRITPTNRKRTGQHHRHGHQYVKSYWPYLPIMAILTLGVVANSWLAKVNHNVLGYASNMSSQALLDDTNAARRSTGETGLQLSNALSAAAQAKANDMVARNYWSHVTPDGKQPWTFIAAQGYQYQQAGENLAFGFGSSSEVISAWMHSPEHRTNILNANYGQVGFAVANSPNYRGLGPETVIVALYAEPTAETLGVNTPVQTADSSQLVARAQALSSFAWSELAIAVLCGAAITLFFVRHGYAWHKVLVRGEDFALHHPFFDIFLISVATLGFLLSHAAGAIL